MLLLFIFSVSNNFAVENIFHLTWSCRKINLKSFNNIKSGRLSSAFKIKIMATQKPSEWANSLLARFEEQVITNIKCKLAARKFLR